VVFALGAVSWLCHVQCSATAGLQRLFADYPELHAYRDRVAALGRGFTVGEHETLMAWPAMKAGIADDLDSAV
jgi:hypothetical protein